MDRSNWPLLLIEGVLVFGGAIGFAWWQLRDVERDRRAAAQRRQAQADGDAATAQTPATPSAARSTSSLSQDIDM